MRLTTLGAVAVGDAAPCHLVAEISNAHNGSKDRAHRLVSAAAAAGAAFIKFQAYLPAELLALRGDGPAPQPWGAHGWTMGSLYERAMTPLEWLPDLFTHARSAGAEPFASVFGETSLRAVMQLEPAAVKIAALDEHNRAFVDLMAVRAEPTALLVSVRTLLASYRHHQWALGSARPLATLYCPPGYPTPEEHIALHPDLFRGASAAACLGASLHTRSLAAITTAVAHGAKLIEVHVHLDAEPSALEADISWTPEELAQAWRAIRTVERVCRWTA